MDRTTGIVKWFDNNKGFGFVNHEDEEEDIFVHYSEIDQDGFKELEENDRVEFEPVQTEDGLQAHDVIRIGQEEAMA